MIFSIKLLFFKEGGSEENPLFQKNVVSSEGLSPKVWEGECLPSGWALGIFFLEKSSSNGSPIPRYS
jgi:hypothetical protein